MLLIMATALAVGMFPLAALAANDSGILKIGDQDEYVMQLQARLKELGYLSGKLTGYFGTVTQQAVIDYQEDNKLTVDGKAGPETLSSLGTSFSLPSKSSVKSGTYYPGDKGAAVSALQEQLKKLEYYEYSSITGYYGPVTKLAVQRFQRTNGLKVDGIAGQETLAVLNSGKATYFCLFPGDRGSDVEAMQKRLAALGYFSGTPTGYFGSVTEQALKEFQAQNNLSVDARAGKNTRALLYAKNAAKWDGVRRVSGSGSSTGSVSSVDKMLQFANDQLGKKYVYSTEGPGTFDCSGFIYYVLRYMGISTSRRSASGFSTVDAWEKISGINTLLPGDLLFFKSDDSARISHTGIYMGSNQFIHASSSTGSVRVSDLTGYYARNFSIARRVF